MMGTMEESGVRAANPEPCPGLKLSFSKDEKENENLR